LPDFSKPWQSKSKIKKHGFRSFQLFWQKFSIIGGIPSMVRAISWRLEKYTTKHQEEVLMVNLETNSGEEDVVLIYNGFSGSLVKPTNYDPDLPIIGEDAKIISIDRLASPYNPDRPQYIQQGLTLPEMEQLLLKSGL
jgi:hypothetical protein